MACKMLRSATPHIINIINNFDNNEKVIYYIY